MNKICKSIKFIDTNCQSNGCDDQHHIWCQICVPIIILTFCQKFLNSDSHGLLIQKRGALCESQHNIVSLSAQLFSYNSLYNTKWQVCRLFDMPMKAIYYFIEFAVCNCKVGGSDRSEYYIFEGSSETFSLVPTLYKSHYSICKGRPAMQTCLPSYRLQSW